MDSTSSRNQTKIITDIINGLETTMISSNNKAAFRRAGLEIDASSVLHRCRINVETLENRIVEANLHPSDLKLDFEKFGFINKNEV